MNFFDKLLQAIERNQSLLYVTLDPEAENQNKTLSDISDRLHLITETANYVCAYKLTLGFYQALGIPGLELLQQTLAAIPSDIPVILDAKHSDINTSTVFAETVFEKWQVDACTLSPYAGLDMAAPFLVYPGKAVFVECYTGNPSAAVLQEYPSIGRPFYLHLVKEAKNWGTPEQLGLEVSGAIPEILGRIRTTAPERLILVQGWPEDQNLEQILAAGLNAYGDGLLLPVPPNLLTTEHPAEAVQSLRDTVNNQRLKIVQESPTCELWLPDVCFLQPSPHRDTILQLYDIGCIVFGDHVQASGAIFPYYIDLRKIISQPQIFHQILSAYSEILKNLHFDRIAGIPYGSLPTATGLALRLDRPMIFPRKEVKSHGTKRVIEGHFQPGEKIVVVDDILISGKSVMQGAEKLKDAGLNVEDIVVLIDHEKGVKDRLRENGYQGHAVLTISEIAETLYQSGRINSEQFQILSH
ncbi:MULTISPECIES: bifunctional orotidine-5'-phosphate decarboxylase/orotate phosphoribosyltransferase [Cyanophyceae]|uniref:bifunctional orotidine-5'-phosphate decarboxylase/orotate phosphoribosyltransferase n=1 Tax=Cyanophyceae TaxID=3028117 RepID=UPI0016840647|nr:bifunctional orotidine-5'-phosphate decarboxylase/orotate phosphoribosyltransferase [Trichocoleus sp. FACHB-40]MBD2005445.1 bifunctional orotidine-5'-phosphate decarboxylase/orotate phosphoribosyltransferase [Trichocoleus sp. FACHB-40]